MEHHGMDGVSGIYYQHQVGGHGDERERVPQWSQPETREFLRVRAELDRSFVETKRNRPLWELVSARMLAAGFSRTPDQCKCKWKNLVTRYKGSEAAEAPGVARQFPFQVEMRAIFAARMERLLSSEGGKREPDVWSEDDQEEEDEEEERWEVEARSKKRRTSKRGGNARIEAAADVEGVKSALREFMEWQAMAEARWAEAAEARELERRAAEEEWRRKMAAMAVRRAEMERGWREREEERRRREEERAERWHQLLLALVSRFTNR